MVLLVGITGVVGLQGVGWLLVLVCGVLLGIVAVLAVLWVRARHRLHAVHTDLQNLQQQLTGLSEQLREAELHRQSERKQLEQPVEQQPMEQQSEGAKPVVDVRSMVPVEVEETVEQTQASAPLSSADKHLLEEVRAYIETHLSRSDLSVEEVSKALGVSRVHLYKKLSFLTSRSPIEYIRLLRLQQAAELLKTTSLPVGTIGARVGIPNPKLFSRYFKEEFGVVPTVYQRTFSGVGCLTNEH